MTRYLPGILAMAIIVVASNILVQFTVGSWLTWGAFTYPFSFLVTEIMNRVYGPAAARRVVLVGFVVGVLCSVVAAGLDKTTVRIAVGSGAAFLVAPNLLAPLRVNRTGQGEAVILCVRRVVHDQEDGQRLGHQRNFA